jgi:hypothetical protein
MNPAADLVLIRRTMAEMKGPWGSEDATIRETIKARLAENGIGAREIGEELAQLRPATIPDWMLELVLQRVLSRRDETVSGVKERPERYTFLVAWASLLFLWVAGLGVSPDLRTQHPLLQGLGTHWNDFLDAQIAAEAARASIFVAEDGGGRWAERAMRTAARGRLCALPRDAPAGVLARRCVRLAKGTGRVPGTGPALRPSRATASARPRPA